MSFRAYLQAIRARCVLGANDGGLGYQEAECDITPHGRPHPRAGKLFLGWFAGPRSQGSDTHDHREYQATAVLSLRINEPLDRVSNALFHQVTSGMMDRVDAVIAMMQNYQWQIMAEANAIIDNAAGGTGVVNGFLEPLRYRSDDGEPQEQSGEWYSADPQKYSAATVAIQFGGAKRLQLLGSVR